MVLLPFNRGVGGHFIGHMIIIVTNVRRLDPQAGDSGKTEEWGQVEEVGL